MQSTRTKRLRSVVQSTAHHAMSGLCYVGWHLGDLCKSQALRQIELDLLSDAIYPEQPAVPKPITLAHGALREKFAEIGESEGVEVSALASAVARFEFLRGREPTGCLVQATKIDGKVVEHAIGWDGETAEIIRL